MSPVSSNCPGSISQFVCRVMASMAASPYAQIFPVRLSFNLGGKILFGTAGGFLFGNYKVTEDFLQEVQRALGAQTARD